MVFLGNQVSFLPARLRIDAPFVVSGCRPWNFLDCARTIGSSTCVATVDVQIAHLPDSTSLH